jgi:hypothetical protein
MEIRQAGEIPTLETRGEAHEKVDKQKRYSQIIECLKEDGNHGLTAKECAVLMMQKGYIPTSERNFTAPRLTEMSQNGIVEPIGKKLCQYTGHKVAVYALRDGQMDIFRV